MGMILAPNVNCDISSTVGGCIGQCYSVFYFAKYHLLPRLFLVFQFYPTSIQMMSVLLYDILMRLLALTGFTLLLFDADAFRLIPHQTPRHNFGVIEARWAWFSEQTGYTGPDAHFPCPFVQLPQVPSCFDFSWILTSRSRLKIRMCVTLLMALLLVKWKEVANTAVRIAAVLELEWPTS